MIKLEKKNRGLKGAQDNSKFLNMSGVCQWYQAPKRMNNLCADFLGCL